MVLLKILEANSLSRPDTYIGRSLIGNIDCSAVDAEPTRALHSVAILFRVMSGLLVLLMLLQLVLGVTSTDEISYGVLFGEAIRLVIFAGLLWAAGDLADLFVKSHCDIRAIRILLARLPSAMSQVPAAAQSTSDKSQHDDQSGQVGTP